MATEVFLSRKEAASFLHSIGCPISPRTLEKLASNQNAGKGPPFRRFRWRQVRYLKDDLRTWAEREVQFIE